MCRVCVWVSAILSVRVLVAYRCVFGCVQMAALARHKTGKVFLYVLLAKDVDAPAYALYAVQSMPSAMSFKDRQDPLELRLLQEGKHLRANQQTQTLSGKQRERRQALNNTIAYTPQ